MEKEVKFTSREQLYKWLRETDTSHKKTHELSSVYYMIRFNGHTEPMHFMHYNGVYFESPCMLRSYNIPESELDNYVKELYIPEYVEEAMEYEKTMQKGDIHYEIDNPQCSPFLPSEFSILDILSEQECLEWLITNNK